MPGMASTMHLRTRSEVCLRDFGKFKLWCSPDGLVGERGGIECKSRAQKFQIEVITKK